MTKEERVIYRKEYYQKNKDREKYNAKLYRKIKPNVRKSSDDKYGKSVKGRLTNYKASAKIRNREFTLDLKYFIDNWNKNCYYCGDKINGIGIDRKDNNIGYIKENVVLCCEMCNRMKLNYTLDNFLLHCEKIVNNYH